MHNNSLANAAAGRQGIVALELNDAGHVIDVGDESPFFPIDDGQFVAAD